MKPSANYASSRQLAAKKQVRLDLRRGPVLSPEDQVLARRKSNFWRWFSFVALLHVLILGIFAWVYEISPTTKPPQDYLNWVPLGDNVKGTPGPQEAPKISQSTPAPSTQAAPAPPPTPPTPPVKPHPVQPPPPVAAVTPPTPVPVPTPKPLLPKPVVKAIAPPIAQEKPVTPPKPKVKVDLSQLVEGPATPAPVKPIAKHKPQVKKTAAEAPATDAPETNAAVKSENTGLSKEQIAQALGKKSENAGNKNATKLGPSGAQNSHANSFADFYAMIRDQVMDKWQHPNQLDNNAVNPIVQIHVEKDGRVPPESVSLVKSSGNPVYDESALTAAKSLGYLLQPLPDGCPADIPITFKLLR